MFEMLSLTVKEEHQLQVFKNEVPRKITGPKQDEVGYREYYTTQWTSYSSPSTVRVSNQGCYNVPDI